ncbi:VWA domain-containing protein [Desulfovibrio sp. OttesenSCG-928-C14]|nr:VWA domain-containing protein [Desulfovibrio sp. OttesenSCG-928-C14]
MEKSFFRSGAAVFPLALALAMILTAWTLLSSSHAFASSDKIQTQSAYSSGALEPGKTVEIDVLVSIKAPEVMVSKRAPVAVSLVIDRSGSMGEAKKISYARQAGQTLVRSLESDDLFALTIYDDKVEVLYPLGKIRNRDQVLKLIEGIHPRGWTFLSGGLEKGIEQLASVKTEGPCRVILLSDGLANSGVTQGELVAAIGAKAKAKGIAVSTIGLGLDFDENLMQQLAQRGGGQYYYIADSEALPSVFKDELNLIANSFTKDVRVIYAQGKGIEEAKVYGYSTQAQGGETHIDMSDLGSGEERQVMLRLKVKADAASGARDLGALKLAYVNQLNGESEEVLVPLSLEAEADAAKRNSLEKEREESIRLVREEALLRKADEAHVLAMRELEQGNIEQAKKNLALYDAELAAAAPANKVLENKLAAMQMDSRRLERAASDGALQKSMAKSAKASAYMSYQGVKKGNLLQSGDQGFMVERLQKALADKGFYKGKVDGSYGKELEQAVKAFQKANSLDADGIAGARTMQALGL